MSRYPSLLVGILFKNLVYKILNRLVHLSVGNSACNLKVESTDQKNIDGSQAENGQTNKSSPTVLIPLCYVSHWLIDT